MADKSAIEWTDATWNPVRGCTRVSEGCRNCYAEGVAYRFSGPGQAYEGLVRIGADGERKREWNGAIRFVEEHLMDPLKWKTPRRIFVNSMSDLFHEGVTDAMLRPILDVIGQCWWRDKGHTFQVLTKRPLRQRNLMLEHYARKQEYADKFANSEMAAMRDSPAAHDAKRAALPLSNLWLGTSVENRKAKHRIDALRETPAAVRFLSLEPLLEDLGELNLEGIDWVIVGGESGKGPGIRPMHPDWPRSVRDQCGAAGVPFFFKQWGEWLPGQNDPHPSGIGRVAHHQDGGWGARSAKASGYVMWEQDGTEHIGLRSRSDLFDVHRWATRVGKKATGDLLDGVQWHQFPEAPTA